MKSGRKVILHYRSLYEQFEKHILDKFDLKFLIDEDEEYLYHNGVEDIDNYLNESMKKYGY